MTAFSYRDFDRQLWEQELEDFVPATVYHFAGNAQRFLALMRREVG